MEYENCNGPVRTNALMYGVVLALALIVIYYMFFREGATSGRYSPRMVPIKDPRAQYGVVPRNLH